MFLINEIITFLATNLVLTQALGTGTLLIMSESRKKLLITSVLITLFTSVGSVMTYLADCLLPEKFSDFKLFCYVIAVGILYIVFLKIFSIAGKEKFSEYKKYIHISVFNCAVMGTLLTISRKYTTIGEYFSAGLTSGLGFVIAVLILMSAYRQLNSIKVPTAFRGFPAMLIYLGIISMAVYTLE